MRTIAYLIAALVYTTWYGLGCIIAGLFRRTRSQGGVKFPTGGNGFPASGRHEPAGAWWVLKHLPGTADTGVIPGPTVRVRL